MKPSLIIGGIVSVVGLLLLCGGLLFFFGYSQTVVIENEAVQVESDLDVENPPLSPEGTGTPAPFTTETEPADDISVDPTE